MPYIPANTGTFGEFGISGIFRGAGVVFFVFIGFDIIATMAQENKKSKTQHAHRDHRITCDLYVAVWFVQFCDDRPCSLYRI